MCRHVVILAVELTTFTHLFTARSGFSPGGNQPWKTSHRRLKTVVHLHPQRMKSIANRTSTDEEEDLLYTDGRLPLDVVSELILGLPALLSL